MIRQAAFIDKNKMLKGALHSHTTRSDGCDLPEDVVRLYKERGFDFLAITDHRRYNYLNFAPDVDITIIPGMEFDNGRNMPCEHGFRTFHTVCIGPSAEDGNGFVHDETFDSANAPDQEAYQIYLDDIHAQNNLTIYCHPQWSSTPPRYFDKQQGNFAMEIWNSGCALEYDMDKDAMYWDDLLGRGIRLFGVATDDAHHHTQIGKGWVMVNAENNVNSILNALKNGAFYSSTGPEIYDFYVENGKAVIECSPVKKVRLHADCHPNMVEVAPFGKTFTRMEIDIANCRFPYDDYVRISVVDEDGHCAWTNPIFFD